jgi:uncharacterized protein YjlB
VTRRQSLVHESLYALSAAGLGRKKLPFETGDIIIIPAGVPTLGSTFQITWTI